MALARITDFSTDLLLPLNTPCHPPPPLPLFASEKSGITIRDTHFHHALVASHIKDEVMVDNLRLALGGTLNLEVLLAAEQQVITATIS